MDPLAFLREELAALEADGLRRDNVSLDGPTGPTIERGGRELINLSSNDYLGLAADPRVRWGAADAALRFGGGSGASRLLGGDLPVHRELERALAELKGTEAALLFASGTQANTAVIPALAGEGDAIFSDALNHASIIDGARLSHAERHVYRHLDLGHLTELLDASRARRRLIVTETLFSMDGDVAPLRELADLADRAGAILMVDEAHATGLFGEGAGLCREHGIASRVPVQLGTLGKALGAAGAYVAGSSALVQFLINRARGYIFSTAPAPATCGAALAAVRIVRSPEGAELRARVRDRTRLLQETLRAGGLSPGGSHQILTLAVPDPRRALEATALLEHAGFFVRAVRPPTVPAGGSRLRLCVSAGHAEADLRGAAVALTTVLSSGEQGRALPEARRTGELGRANRQVELRAKDFASLWHPFTQMQSWFAEEPLIIARGEGSYLYDVTGGRYLDGVSSLWANVHGHRRPEIDAAVAEQLTRVAHTTLLGLSSPPAIELADALVQRAPELLTRVFYSDDGSTAAEIALKMAFQYFRQRGEPERRKFLAFGEGYHGDTLGAVSAGGIAIFHEIFRQLLFPVIHAPTPSLDPDARAVTRLIADHGTELAAVLIEPLVQGAGGMLLQPPGFLRRVREACDAHGVLLIADEVATGFGRTGTFFACEQEDVAPDLLCLGKGISGGYLPLAATLAQERVFAGFLGTPVEQRTFFHGHTFTGNPLACAAGLASLKLFETDRTLERLQPKIAQLAEGLGQIAEHPHVLEVRQRGFMVGIELGWNKEAGRRYPPEARMGHQVILEARRRGVILRPLGDVVVLVPPLSISPEELQTLLETTAISIEAVTSRFDR